ncbi:hypothetical protein ABB37_04337 [Leptomonas pyrrhocoris]|uniref:Uncharacterized protein n=1 Tax=Leptomonas pyrrhocoris TaxID=157538 RepID=A0A0N0DVW5_LEPPY|nr:hypothetical protein ABB37_04337 [Leptomonas pyrrhocoris]XP_015659381.1 hypothetical protein ABB37_04337 [Leptomonas pyrrhocoris]KPA80941.1 hypothetical protein ABB37_04337 [Leptomonas pyrrhocoris]KPA80942.1 hypothetical protein ABB37_04337 [Leptomonas pyrrhocoris]|eukprot:XP_015659380.1 hypothetical protein ABB37_04337 [Leptomonas pyrrhocoris]
MSGAGRKHRAKHLTRQYLDVSGWVGPKEGETLAVCLESPHGQHVRVLLLFAHPENVPKLSEADAEAENQTAVAPASGGDNTASASPAPEEQAGALLEKEQLVFLPRKFHKVIWLSIKDIVVVSDGTVTFKPSPEQLENFLKDPAHGAWRERVSAAQKKAEDQRVAVQRMPQYGSTTHTTTSVLTGPQVHRGTQQSDDGEDGEEEVDELVNPNRGNIKHHQQFFYGMDDDSDTEDDDEEAAQDN